METQKAQKKPRIFELWEEIFGPEPTEHEAVTHGGKKIHDRQ
jgi:hypothetical protein